MNRRLARIEPVAAYDDIGQCDVVIEAVFERMDVKKPVFAKLDEVMKPGALLFSNTSGIDIDLWPMRRERPQDVAGTHFFAPANVMKLLEVVRGAKSAPDTLLTAMESGPPDRQDLGDGRQHRRLSSPIARARRSTPRWSSCSRKAVCRNRWTRSWWISAIRWGRSRWATFRASTSAMTAASAAPPRTRTTASCRSPIAWRSWAATARRPARAGIATKRATALRIPIRRSPRSSRRSRPNLASAAQFTDQEILRRLLFSSVNEACRILEEGKAYRAGDIDVMWLHGFGFPRYRGGLLYWADGIGVRDVYNQIAAWHQQYGERWAPAPCCANSRKPAHRSAKPNPARPADPGRQSIGRTSGAAAARIASGHGAGRRASRSRWTPNWPSRASSAPLRGSVMR